MKKRLCSVVLAGMLLVTSLAGCGGSGSSSDSSGDKVSFTIFNSKTEIQEYLEQAAEDYSAENNCDIEVYYSNDTVSAHLASKYAASDPYTINMVDAKDVYSLGKEYGYDLSSAQWVNDTDYAITVDDKVLGFPVCIEARGILYNNKAIKGITGEDVDSFVDSLYAGSVDLTKDEKYNALMDTFDTLMKYNIWGDAPIAVEDDQVHQVMAEAQVAFQFGGCWEWNDIVDYDYEAGSIGMMPVPQNMQDAYTGCLVGGGSKYFYVDNSENTTDEQREAAAAFLEWFASSDEGKTLVSEECAMVSPFKSNTVECANELGQYVKQYVDEGKLVPNYDYDPDDHYSKVGAYMQEYLAGLADRAQLADKVEEYWSTVTPVEH